VAQIGSHSNETGSVDSWQRVFGNLHLDEITRGRLVDYASDTKGTTVQPRTAMIVKDLEPVGATHRDRPHGNQGPTHWKTVGQKVVTAARVSVVATALCFMSPTGPQAQNRQGGTSTESCDLGGRNDLSLKDLDSIISRYPTCVRAFVGRGNEYMNKQRYDEAIKDYGEAIRLDPSYTNAFYNRALVYGIEQKFELAIRDLDVVIRRNPNDADAISKRMIDHMALVPYRRALVTSCVKSHQIIAGMMTASVSRTAAAEAARPAVVR
jgi:hypothetical protein